MSIYITKQKKEELEAKIAELEYKEENEFFDEYLINDYLSQIKVYKELLLQAIILPVEESFEKNGVIISEKNGCFKTTQTE